MAGEILTWNVEQLLSCPAGRSRPGADDGGRPFRAVAVGTARARSPDRPRAGGTEGAGAAAGSRLCARHCAGREAARNDPASGAADRGSRRRSPLRAGLRRCRPRASCRNLSPARAFLPRSIAAAARPAMSGCTISSTPSAPHCRSEKGKSHVTACICHLRLAALATAAGLAGEPVEVPNMVIRLVEQVDAPARETGGAGRP